MKSLDRFVSAQDQIYPRALDELRAGAKRSHWMWYIFPQLAGLGHSAMAQRYAITDLAEARAYLDHFLLGPRLRECTEAMLSWAGRKNAQDVLGAVDALKFGSSMTLFEAVEALPFSRALDAFGGGTRDAMTLERL